ncbi:cyclic AMP-dependent transcription factor ATF-7-like isoform X2 [Amphiura filiformis]|uniref:cyclic AMP-dependent transcription factor ATF-7-like isoform X2 n=1 Tax=Amphiura filiformis TaxID=82378 RepID=UPI003B22779A
MNSAKPFVCPAIGCNQQFANEDHLEVHRRKHEMSLGLRDFKSSLDTPIIADQTPTPTRFLKNCEEVGLFSELPNPFDAEFRKASELQKDDKHDEVNEDDVDAEGDSQDDTSNTHTHIENSKEDDVIGDPTLNTVIVTIGETTSTTATASPPAVSSTTHEEEVLGVVSVAPQNLTTTTAAAVRPVSIFKHVQVQSVNQQIQQQQQTLAAAVSQQQAVAAAVQQQQAAAAAAQQQQAVAVSSVPSVVTQVIQGLATSTAGVIASVAPTAAPKVAVANVNAPFLNTIPISAPILLRLPNGQTIPVVPPSVANPAVQIPLAISAVAEPPQISKAGGTNAVIAVAEKADVKLKLKNALLTSQSQGNMGVMTQAVEVVTRQQQAVTSTSTQQNILQTNKMEVTVEQVSPGDIERSMTPEPQFTPHMRRRRSSDDDGGDGKRQRFLERNRAAATRCRNKRKQWITNLESKADELNTTNVKLQNEVTTLRNEVAQLKQLLLAHKDCPVTLMQRSGTSDLQEPELMDTATTANMQQQPTVITVQTISANHIKQMAGPST